eukprot:14241537-Heterocapsa_arctica.AAC.2
MDQLEDVRSERAHGRTHGTGWASAGYGDDYFASRGIPPAPQPRYVDRTGWLSWSDFFAAVAGLPAGVPTTGNRKFENTPPACLIEYRRVLADNFNYWNDEPNSSTSQSSHTNQTPVNTGHIAETTH